MRHFLMSFLFKKFKVPELAVPEARRRVEGPIILKWAAKLLKIFGFTHFSVFLHKIMHL